MVLEAARRLSRVRALSEAVSAHRRQTATGTMQSAGPPPQQQPELADSQAVLLGGPNNPLDDVLDVARTVQAREGSVQVGQLHVMLAGRGFSADQVKEALGNW